jgi:hypothetical protein
MDFIKGSYCIDTLGAGKIESIEDQEDVKSAGPTVPDIPYTKRLQELIDTPYEGLGLSYFKRIIHEWTPDKAGSFSLNINASVYPLSPWIHPRVIKETVERVSDFIPPRRRSHVRLKDLSDRELWEIAFYMVRHLPDYGRESAEHFWHNSGTELIHTHAKKSLLEKGPLRKLLDAVNRKVSDTIFRNGKRVFPIPDIDVTDVIRDNFPSLKMDQFKFVDKAFNISEIGVFGGIKEVTITGQLEDLTNYTDFASQFSDNYQPYSLLIILKDLFGVSEDDVVNAAEPAVLQRYQLAAFWLLQHQRGYKTFVNTLQFDRHHEFAQNNTQYQGRIK